MSEVAESGGGLVDRIATAAGELSLEVVDVSANVQDISAVIEGQAAAFEQLVGSAAAVSRSNNEILEVAQTTRESTSEAAKEIASSRQTVERSLEDIHALLEVVGRIQVQLNGLQTALAEVGKVASDIDAIARQTNLLALNATIEAARAGEAGRGFAVVAGEVKALAGQTSEATAKIDHTLEQLTQQARQLIEQGEESTGRAEKVREGTSTIGSVIEAVGGIVEEVQTKAQAIASAAGEIEQQSRGFTETLEDMSAEVGRSSRTLVEARDRVGRLVEAGEALVDLTAASPENHIDRPFVEKAQAVAEQVIAAFERALAAGEIDERGLFDQTYVPVKSSNPEQVMTAYTLLTDRLLPPLQEPVLEWDSRVVFCAAVDVNGYLPTHNLKFSKPQGADPTWNNAHCRNRRLFNDRVGLTAGRNLKPFLLQTYRRDMGGGQFAMMKDVSAPITVRGRHWGAVRLAYRPQ